MGDVKKVANERELTRKERRRAMYATVLAEEDDEYVDKLKEQVKKFAPEAIGRPVKVMQEAVKQAHYVRMRNEITEDLKANETDDAYEGLVNMRRFKLKPNKAFYEQILTNFAENKQVNKVKEVLAFMERDDVIADELTHMSIVRAYGRIKHYEWVKRAFLRMCEKIQPSVSSYREVIAFFAQDPHIANVRKAEEVFYTAHRYDVRPDPKTCFLFIRHLVETQYEGDVDRAIEVLKFMKTKNIEPIHEGTPLVFRKHLRTLVKPRMFLRMKKVLVGLQHSSMPEKHFQHYWDLVKAKKWIHKIKRADLAPP